jgi:hypothetical protein
MVKQLVAVFNLPTMDTDLSLLSGPDYSANQIDTVTSLDFADPAIFHNQAGSAIVSFHDRPWFPLLKKPTAAVFRVTIKSDIQYVLFEDSMVTDHVVYLLQEAEIVATTVSFRRHDVTASKVMEVMRTLLVLALMSSFDVAAGMTDWGPA